MSVSSAVYALLVGWRVAVVAGDIPSVTVAMRVGGFARARVFVLDEIYGGLAHLPDDGLALPPGLGLSTQLYMQPLAAA